MTYAAFRWASSFPGDELSPGHTTLVEFTVTPTNGGVAVAVLESGFAKLDAPDEIKSQSVESNSDGWPQELESLRTRAEL